MLRTTDLVQMTSKRFFLAVIILFVCFIVNARGALAKEKILGDDIRGTDCDQRIQSKGSFSGVIESFDNARRNLLCHSFFHGLQCSHQKEPIRLTNDKDGKTRKRCRESFLKSHLTVIASEQNHDDDDDSNNSLDRHCKELFSFEDLKSGLPNVVISYSSGKSGKNSFRAHSAFKTDYGTTAAIPDGFCHFKYNSTGVIKGNVDSPEQDFNCSYTFRQKDDIVHIFFDKFKNELEVLDEGHWDICRDDWVEVYLLENNTEKSLSRYCRSTAQGAIVTLEKSEVVKVLMSCGVEEIHSFFNARFLHFSSSFDVSSSNNLRRCFYQYALQLLLLTVFIAVFKP